jgi:hypothetical protein
MGPRLGRSTKGSITRIQDNRGRLGIGLQKSETNHRHSITAPGEQSTPRKVPRRTAVSGVRIGAACGGWSGITEVKTAPCPIPVIPANTGIQWKGCQEHAGARFPQRRS